MKQTGSWRLLEWALAAFHTAFFFAAAFGLLYRAGGLGDLLGSLNTLIGIGGFVAVWALTWWTTRMALAGVDWLALERPRLLPMLRRGMIWGGVNGMLVFLVAEVIFVVAVTLPVLLQEPDQAMINIVPLVVFGLIGTVVAFVFGATIGLSLVGLDLLIVLATWRLTSGIRATDASEPAVAQPPC